MQLTPFAGDECDPGREMLVIGVHMGDVRSPQHDPVPTIARRPDDSRWRAVGHIHPGLEKIVTRSRQAIDIEIHHPPRRYMVRSCYGSIFHGHVDLIFDHQGRPDLATRLSNPVFLFEF